MMPAEFENAFLWGFPLGFFAGWIWHGLLARGFFRGDDV